MKCFIKVSTICFGMKRYLGMSCSDDESVHAWCLILRNILIEESTKTIQEDREQFLKIAFTHALDSIKNWKAKNGNAIWYGIILKHDYPTSHDAASLLLLVSNVKIGGNSHIINACNSLMDPVVYDIN